jgi:hypothetical protein
MLIPKNIRGYFKKSNLSLKDEGSSIDITNSLFD